MTLFQFSKSISFKLMSFSLSLAMVSGCAKDHGSQAQSEKTSESPASEASSRKSELSRPHIPKLECQTPEFCHSVVQIVTWTPMKGFYFCTGARIGEDLIATASHCVPWELVTGEKPMALAPGCWARWLDEKLEEAWTTCHEVLAATKLSPDRETMIQMDSAIIRLNELDKDSNLPHWHPVGTYVTPMPKPEEFRVIGISPGPDKHIINVRNCKNQPGLHITGKSAPPPSVLMMPNCGGIPGHSGGPILDIDHHDQLVAVISYGGTDSFNPATPVLVATPISSVAVPAQQRSSSLN